MTLLFLLSYTVAAVVIFHTTEKFDTVQVIQDRIKSLSIDPVLDILSWTKVTQDSSDSSEVPIYPDLAIVWLHGVLTFIVGILLTITVFAPYQYPPKIPEPLVSNWADKAPNKTLTQYLTENKKTIQSYGFEEFIISVEENPDTYQIFTRSATVSIYEELFIDLVIAVISYMAIVAMLLPLYWTVMYYFYPQFLSWVARLYLKPFLNANAFRFSSEKELGRLRAVASEPLTRDDQFFLVDTSIKPTNTHAVPLIGLSGNISNHNLELMAKHIQAYRLGYQDQLLLILQNQFRRPTNVVQTFVNTLQIMHMLTTYFTFKNTLITPFCTFSSIDAYASTVNLHLNGDSTTSLLAQATNIYLPLGKHSDTSYYCVDLKEFVEEAVPKYIEIQTAEQAKNLLHALTKNWQEALKDLNLSHLVHVKDLNLGTVPAYFKSIEFLPVYNTKPHNTYAQLSTLLRSFSEI